MSVQTQIDRIAANIAAALSAIAEKGVTVPDGSNSDALAGLIQAIQAGEGGTGDIKLFGDYQYRFGSFTLSEDITTDYTVNFDTLTCPYPKYYNVFLFLDEKETRNSGINTYSGRQMSIAMYGYSWWANGGSSAVYYRYGRDSSGSNRMGSFTADRTDSSFTIPFASSDGMMGIAGCKYFWIIVSKDY